MTTRKSQTSGRLPMSISIPSQSEPNTNCTSTIYPLVSACPHTTQKSTSRCTLTDTATTSTTVAMAITSTASTRTRTFCWAMETSTFTYLVAAFSWSAVCAFASSRVSVTVARCLRGPRSKNALCSMRSRSSERPTLT